MSRIPHGRTLITSVGLALIPLCVLAEQPFPSRPVTVIVTFAPGGAGEIPGRLLARRISADLGQNMVVELKQGAGSMLGSEHVAKVARADRWTLLLDDPLLTINTSFMNLAFDPGRDIVPVSDAAGLPLPKTPEAFNGFYQVDIDRWAALANQRSVAKLD